MKRMVLGMGTALVIGSAAMAQSLSDARAVIFAGHDSAPMTRPRAA